MKNKQKQAPQQQTEHADTSVADFDNQYLKSLGKHEARQLKSLAFQITDKCNQGTQITNQTCQTQKKHQKSKTVTDVLKLLNKCPSTTRNINIKHLSIMSPQNQIQKIYNREKYSQTSRNNRNPINETKSNNLQKLKEKYISNRYNQSDQSSSKNNSILLPQLSIPRPKWLNTINSSQMDSRYTNLRQNQFKSKSSFIINSINSQSQTTVNCVSQNNKTKEQLLKEENIQDANQFKKQVEIAIDQINDPVTIKELEDNYESEENKLMMKNLNKIVESRIKTKQNQQKSQIAKIAGNEQIQSQNSQRNAKTKKTYKQNMAAKVVNQAILEEMKQCLNSEDTLNRNNNVWKSLKKKRQESLEVMPELNKQILNLSYKKEDNETENESQTAKTCAFNKQSSDNQSSLNHSYFKKVIINTMRAISAQSMDLNKIIINNIFFQKMIKKLQEQKQQKRQQCNNNNNTNKIDSNASLQHINSNISLQLINADQQEDYRKFNLNDSSQSNQMISLKQTIYDNTISAFKVLRKQKTLKPEDLFDLEGIHDKLENIKKEEVIHNVLKGNEMENIIEMASETIRQKFIAAYKSLQIQLAEKVSILENLRNTNQQMDQELLQCENDLIRNDNNFKKFYFQIKSEMNGELSYVDRYSANKPAITKQINSNQIQQLSVEDSKFKNDVEYIQAQASTLHLTPEQRNQKKIQLLMLNMRNKSLDQLIQTNDLESFEEIMNRREKIGIQYMSLPKNMCLQQIHLEKLMEINENNIIGIKSKIKNITDQQKIVKIEISKARKVLYKMKLREKGVKGHLKTLLCSHMNRHEELGYLWLLQQLSQLGIKIRSELFSDVLDYKSAKYLMNMHKLKMLETQLFMQLSNINYKPLIWSGMIVKPYSEKIGQIKDRITRLTKTSVAYQTAKNMAQQQQQAQLSNSIRKRQLQAEHSKNILRRNNQGKGLTTIGPGINIQKLRLEFEELQRKLKDVQDEILMARTAEIKRVCDDYTTTHADKDKLNAVVVRRLKLLFGEEHQQVLKQYMADLHHQENQTQNQIVEKNNNQNIENLEISNFKQQYEESNVRNIQSEKNNSFDQYQPHIRDYFKEAIFSVKNIKQSQEAN